MKFVPLTLCAMLLGSCAIKTNIDTLGAECPPPEFGRPGWVRACAGTGAWIGGVLGGLVSIVALPISYPISLLADDGLNEHTRMEFLLWPAMGGAAIGHALLGGPPDALDYVFHRAWVDSPSPVTSYELIPMADPAVPKAASGK